MSEENYRLEEGQVIRFDGDGTEYEVVSRVIPSNLGYAHYVIVAKPDLDEADPSRVTAPEAEEDNAGEA